MDNSDPYYEYPMKCIISEDSYEPRKKLLYFAYCVNMLSSRMEFCVDKNVLRKGIGKLDGYKLMFGLFNDEWEGCLPTIVKTKNSDDVVWGTLWEMDERLKARLDSLQGSAYEEVEVLVTSFRAKGSLVRALSYRLTTRPLTPILPKPKELPSKLYLEEMVLGAEEAGLPSYYLKWLKTIPHNGNVGTLKSSVKLQQLSVIDHSRSFPVSYCLFK